MDHSSFIHSSIDGHWGCFHLWAIANYTAVNINVQEFVQFFWSYLSRLSESHANSMFNFLRNPQSHSTVAESFYSPISSMRGFRCFHIHDNSGSFPFFCNFNSHPSRCKVLSRVLICISLMPNDTEYFFLCLFTMSLPSLEKYLFHSHTHFLIELFIFVHVCLLHWKSPFHILDTRFTNM